MITNLPLVLYLLPVLVFVNLIEIYCLIIIISLTGTGYSIINRSGNSVTACGKIIYMELGCTQYYLTAGC
jgi:hypothetical protein